jgi:hypothetical protein
MNARYWDMLLRCLAGPVLLALTAVDCDRDKPDARPNSSPPVTTQAASYEAPVPVPSASDDSHTAELGVREGPAPSVSLPPESPALPVQSGPATSMPVTAISSPISAFHPLADAVVGEWARYTALDDRVVRYVVKEAGSVTVKTEVTVYDQGKPLGLPAVREDSVEFDPVEHPESAGVEQTRARVTVAAAGRSWDAVLYEDRWLDEGVHYVRRTWVSPAVPVFGIIRMELTGDGTLEARLDLMDVGQAK